MKVLLVEDDPVDAMLVTEALKGAGIDDVASRSGTACSATTTTGKQDHNAESQREHGVHNWSLIHFAPPVFTC